MRYVAYLCLQATRPGQASYAHVHEIIKGLRKRNWRVELFEPRGYSAHLLPKVIAFITTQVRLWMARKPDVLYIRWHPASFPSAVTARMLGIPVVQEVNGPYDDLFIAWPWTRRLSRLFVWLLRSQLNLATAVVAVTPQLAEWVKREIGSSGRGVFVVPNGANTDLFHPAAKERHQPMVSGQYVIFVGALARWQGIDVMLNATEHPLWPPDVSLVIVGDGAERTKVESFAGRSRRVQYLGQQPYEVVPVLIAQSLGGLSPKVGEWGGTGLLPLKVFEYLACGVPAIVTDFPGMADIVLGGRCGLVVSPNSAEELARAVSYLASNAVERQEMGERGRKLVEAEHSWDQRSEDTSRILSFLVP